MVLMSVSHTSGQLTSGSENVALWVRSGGGPLDPGWQQEGIPGACCPGAAQNVGGKLPHMYAPDIQRDRWTIRLAAYALRESRLIDIWRIAVC